MEAINLKLHYELYKKYGISEWKEKCLILSLEEQKEILETIRENKTSLLLEIVKLPYPEFIRKYYLTFYAENLKKIRKLSIIPISKYIDYDSFVHDKTLGYRFYIMPMRFVQKINATIKAHVSLMHGESEEVLPYLEVPLDQIHYIGQFRTSSNVLKNYIYIMQYVDEQEAQEMGLSSFTFYNNGTHKGFDLNEKLDLFNSLERHILISYLGLSGKPAETLCDICERLDLSIASINFLLNKNALYNLTRSLGELKSYMRFKGENQEVNGYMEYSRYDFIRLANNLEFIFIYKHLPEEDKEKFRRMRSYYMNYTSNNIPYKKYCHDEINRILVEMQQNEKHKDMIL